MNLPDDPVDLIIIGGGIVGLATAHIWLQSHPGQSVVVLEKESQLALHQTGRNSGVLHSGIYYRPGSLKARMCRAGKLAMETFCTDEKIPFERCGKVIVATAQEEFSRLEAIYARGQENGVECELIGRERLLEIEPHAAGLKAIHVPGAGIVDYATVTRRLADRVREAGGLVLTGARFESLVGRSPVRIRATFEVGEGEVVGRQVVNCTGLQVDRVSRELGVEPVWTQCCVGFGAGRLPLAGCERARCGRCRRVSRFCKTGDKVLADREWRSLEVAEQSRLCASAATVDP